MERADEGGTDQGAAAVETLLGGQPGAGLQQLIDAWRNRARVLRVEGHEVGHALEATAWRSPAAERCRESIGARVEALERLAVAAQEVAEALEEHRLAVQERAAVLGEAAAEVMEFAEGMGEAVEDVAEGVGEAVEHGPEIADEVLRRLLSGENPSGPVTPFSRGGAGR